MERVWNGGSRRLRAPGGLVIPTSLKVWTRVSRMFGMAGCHVAENDGRQLLPALDTKSHLKLFVCLEGEFHNFLLFGRRISQLFVSLAGEFLQEIPSFSDLIP